MKVLMVDPPEGWRYGFPKQMPSGILWPRDEWYLANGYPQKLIDQGMLQYCRAFEMEIED